MSWKIVPNYTLALEGEPVCLRGGQSNEAIQNDNVQTVTIWCLLFKQWVTVFSSACLSLRPLTKWPKWGICDLVSWVAAQQILVASVPTSSAPVHTWESVPALFPHWSSSLSWILLGTEVLKELWPSMSFTVGFLDQPGSWTRAKFVLGLHLLF